MRANAAAVPALNPTCRFRGDTLQDHQCQLEKTGEAVKYVLVYLVLSLGMCELSKKGTLCGETLGPEKGSGKYRLRHGAAFNERTWNGNVRRKVRTPGRDLR